MTAAIYQRMVCYIELNFYPKQKELKLIILDKSKDNK